MSRNRRGGLGRGIGALIPSAPVVHEPATAAVAETTDPSGDKVEIASVPGNGAVAPTDRPIPAVADEVEETAPQDMAPRDMTPQDTTEPAATIDADDVSVDVSRETWNDDAVEATGVDDLVAVPGAYFREIPVDAIRANAKQPRTIFDDDSLAELTHSIREFGVLQPVVVRMNESGYELVMGERRLRAAVAAGLTVIPAVVRDTADDAMLRDALLENIHRAQLNPLEEAAAYQQLLEEFGVTHEELAARIGRSRSQVSNTVRLMNLSVPVQRRVAAGVLSAGHARALLGLSDSEAQDELAGRIVAEGLSVRATEELVALAGQEGPAKHRRPVRRFTAPAAHDLAEKLSDAFETRVKVDIGRHKGKITVEFGSIADLERIIDVMVPGLNPRVPAPIRDTR